VGTLVKYRESILPYLRAADSEAGRIKQTKRWENSLKAAVLNDQAHVLNLAGHHDTPEYEKLSVALDAQYRTYAPWRFLRNEVPDENRGTPRLLKQIKFGLVGEKGDIITVQFSAVIFRGDNERARVFFVDNNSHTIFGILRVRGANREAYIAGLVDDLLKEVQELYSDEQKIAVVSGQALPSATSLLPRIKNLVELKIDQEKM
jgi:hypothetical protein